MRILCHFILLVLKNSPCLSPSTDKEIRNCPIRQFYYDQNHLNTHHIIITTSALVSRSIPGGFESSIGPFAETDGKMLYSKWSYSHINTEVHYISLINLEAPSCAISYGKASKCAWEMLGFVRRICNWPQIFMSVISLWARKTVWYWLYMVRAFSISVLRKRLIKFNRALITLTWASRQMKCCRLAPDYAFCFLHPSLSLSLSISFK